MALLHEIRLQGPWEVRFPEESDSGEFQSVKLPADWQALFGDISGTVLFQRRFNRPTGLINERVAIRIPAIKGQVRQVRLNEQPLLPFSEEASHLWDGTAALQPFNLLEIEFHGDCEPPDAEGGFPAVPVTLELYTAADT